MRFCQTYVLQFGAFHENDGNHENDENDEATQTATSKGVDCWGFAEITESTEMTKTTENPGCKPRVPQNLGLEKPDFSNGIRDQHCRNFTKKFPASVGRFCKPVEGRLGPKQAMVQYQFQHWYAPCTESGLAASFNSLPQLRGLHGMETAPLEAPKEASLKPDMQARKELAQSKPRRQAER